MHENTVWGCPSAMSFLNDCNDMANELQVLYAVPLVATTFGNCKMYNYVTLG